MSDLSVWEAALPDERQIDETLEASFPASDPPSWNLGIGPRPFHARSGAGATRGTAGPHPHYPHHLVSHWRTPDGARVSIRPIRSADADLVRGFVQRLSPETRYFRFMSGVRELSGETLDRLTRIDYERDMALIAVMNEGGVERLVGVARYAGHPDGESCEFAIVVADDWKGRRLGRHLITLLVEVARARGYKRMDGDVLPVNRRMLEFARSLGFELTMPTNGAPVVRATLRVSVGEHAASHL